MTRYSTVFITAATLMLAVTALPAPVRRDESTSEGQQQPGVVSRLMNDPLVSLRILPHSSKEQTTVYHNVNQENTETNIWGGKAESSKQKPKDDDNDQDDDNDDKDQDDGNDGDDNDGDGNDQDDDSDNDNDDDEDDDDDQDGDDDDDDDGNDDEE